MPKKFKVVQVTIRRATPVDNYTKLAAPYGNYMKELLKGVADLKNWTVTTSGDKATGAYPEVDKHKSHGQGKEWKLQVDPGNRSQDRLWVKVTEITQEPAKTDPNTVNVKVKASVTVEEDTHKRDSRK
jgi:hypothetical protein